MPRKKSKANYFTKETEDYIVKYNTSTDDEYRAKIFTDHIYLPFYKLSENIIHTFKFYYTDVEQIEDLKHEVVTVLLEEKIMKFDPTNGAKTFPKHRPSVWGPLGSRQSAINRESPSSNQTINHSFSEPMN